MKKIFLLPILFLALFAGSCSKDEKKPIEPPKKEETLNIYKDVKLKLADAETDNYGIAFSSATGKTYKASEISTKNIAEIDIVSFNLQAFIAFESPNESDYTKNIEGVTATKIQHKEVAMTTAVFDAMEDDTVLKKLTVTNDEESLPTTYRKIILFENSKGKKGAIKVKEINRDRILFDVKVMK